MGNRIYSRLAAQIRSAVDIVDVVSEVVLLKATGSDRYVGLCPFHQERTPSFHVSREKQVFYCFGCQKGGDVIKFVREFEGLEFQEAIIRLAQRYGIPIEPIKDNTFDDEVFRERLRELNKAAMAFFQKCLEDPLKGSIARHYLAKRHFSEMTIKKFGIGYAPEQPDLLLQAMRRLGFKDDVLLASGLMRTSVEGPLYPFFRQRIMIPIRDTSGRVLAFGGRDITNDPKLPKYINTPENAIYKKGRELFGLFEAREALREQRYAVLVEGYFDLMRCFDCGIHNVVATCGTALTQDQAVRLRRHVPEVIIMYDGDAAGIRAALRGVALLVAAGLTVKACVIPEAKDPDEYLLAYGTENFQHLISAASDFVTFYVNMNNDRTMTIEGRTEIARELFTILLNIEDELRIEEYLKRIAHQLRVDYWALRREFARIRDTSTENGSDTSPTYEIKSAAVNFDDTMFIAALLQSEPLRRHVREEIAGLILEPAAFKQVLHHVLGLSEVEIPEDAEEEATLLLAAAANAPAIPPDKREELVEKRLKRLRQNTYNAELNKTLEEIRLAEAANDLAQLKILMIKQVELKRELEKLGTT